jgi:uncharacterized iron-regulated membrane protein
MQMLKTRVGLVLVVVLLLALAWSWEELPQLKQWVQRGQAALPARLGNNDTLTTLPAAPAGVHKCLRGGQVVYSDAPCPRGQQEQVIRQGSVTVVKLPAPAASEAASGPSTVRSLLGKPDEATLLDKQIERATR